METPKVAETNFVSVDAFPLKKDEKAGKPIKLVTEEKKSVQKPLEPSLVKKPIELAKKIKREKHNGSTDSEDSDTESEILISFTM